MKAEGVSELVGEKRVPLSVGQISPESWVRRIAASFPLICRPVAQKRWRPPEAEARKREQSSRRQPLQ